MTELHGFLDHLRENLEILDEQIENAREMSKSKEKTDNSLQWAKTLRDLIELRNATMDKIKAHLLGRDETGTVKEPLDFHSPQSHPLTLFERQVHDCLATPWTVERLKIKCAKCGIESDSTRTRTFERFYTTNNYGQSIQYKDRDLCDSCYDSTLQEIYAEVKAAREKNGWTLS